jgi:dTDP-4-amino-4,6-dideoxygalactose transaminase
LAVAYAKAFAALGLPSVRYVFADRAAEGTAHVGAVLVPAEARDEVRKALADARIQTSLHYPPIHHFSAFSAGGAGPSGLPRTEAFAGCVITLPLYPGLPDAAVPDIVGAIQAALTASPWHRNEPDR